MPRWAIVITVVPLVLCLGCVAVGYIAVHRLVDEVVPDLQDDVSDEMAVVLSEYVSRRIDASARAEGGLDAVDEVVFRPVDLNVNNLLAPGQAGIETGPEGTVIYGVETRISPTGVTLVLPGATFTAMPVVANGRIELTGIEAGENPMGFIFSAEAFEQAIEGGFDDAFRRHGLTPVSLALATGVMTVRVIPDACLGSPEAMAACRPATPIAATPGPAIGDHIPSSRAAAGPEVGR
jgi:hypothetical protein